MQNQIPSQGPSLDGEVWGAVYVVLPDNKFDEFGLVHHSNSSMLLQTDVVHMGDIV